MAERDMKDGGSVWPRRTLLLGGGSSLLLAACSAPPVSAPSQPSFYRNLAQAGARVDAAMAAEMISGFRRNNGRGNVTVDPVLMAVAEAQAAAMTQADQVGVRTGAVGARLTTAGYRHRTAVENTSAGYLTLAEAFSGWRDSPSHNKNMLLTGATKMGIAAAYAPNSKYKVFWALVLAEPDK